MQCWAASGAPLCRSVSSCARKSLQCGEGLAAWRTAPDADGENRYVAGLLGGDVGRQHVILELVAQGRLLDFAGCRVWNGADEHDIVGHPPLGDLALDETEYFLFGRRLPLLEHDDEQRPLVPLGMPHADHRRLSHLGMADREI